MVKNLNSDYSSSRLIINPQTPPAILSKNAEVKYT